MLNKKFEAKSNKKGRYIENVFEVPIFSGNRAEVLKLITDRLDKKVLGKPYFVVTINTEMLVNSSDDLAYKKVLQSADLLVPDANGLRLLGVKNIYPGRRLVEDLLLMKKYRVYFLGGKGGVAKQMAIKYGGQGDEGADKIQFEIRNLKSMSNITILNKINRYKPDLLFVAYGAPWQEKWISENRNKIKAKVVMGVGGAFDYLTGKSQLPPKIIENLGLEWLWRLIRQPWRWRRQLKLLQFLQIVWRSQRLQH